MTLHVAGEWCVREEALAILFLGENGETLPLLLEISEKVFPVKQQSNCPRNKLSHNRQPLTFHSDKGNTAATN